MNPFIRAARAGGIMLEVPCVCVHLSHQRPHQICQHVTKSRAPHVPRRIKPGKPILVPLDLFRPTQMAVGMRAVAAKREKIESRSDKPRKMMRYLENRPIPAVLGPNNAIYIIDHHHLSLALWQSDIQDAFVDIIDDLSHVSPSRFWNRMAADGRIHPFNSSGQSVQAAQLPTHLRELASDPYRDLAWSVREAGGFAKTTTPYSEFRWAAYFRRHIAPSTVRRDFDLAHDQAMWLARSRSAARLPGFKGEH